MVTGTEPKSPVSFSGMVALGTEPRSHFHGIDSHWMCCMVCVVSIGTIGGTSDKGGASAGFRCHLDHAYAWLRSWEDHAAEM